VNQPVLVYGVGVAGLATVRALLARGYEVVAVDDVMSDAKKVALHSLGLSLVGPPPAIELDRMVKDCAFVAPAPGLAEDHPVVLAAIKNGVALRSELDLAYEWEQMRPGGPRPMVAVTGTDGKTTTVSMVEAIVNASGQRSIACGNTEIPLVEALDLDVDVFVVEATSFRLAFIEQFRTVASAWINLAPDHLDWHRSMGTYEAAKARLWQHVRSDDVAIGFVGDDVVMKHLRQARCRQVAFGLDAGDYRRDGDHLVGPSGPIMNTADLRRSLPHDVTNALAASALVLESGLGSVETIASALHDFLPPHHRIEFVAEHNGVRWFDDSKATTPHAAVTAIRGFESVVLIAGGRNKGLDLRVMSEAINRVRSVIALGESASEIVQAFQDKVPVTIVGSMREAVETAQKQAQAPDVVLLSPGCTSLDWYTGYAERGTDFVRQVAEVTGAISPRILEIRS
jgi:UDP-N-acetylmuramoylalanine--D-glutamate ligase